MKRIEYFPPIEPDYAEIVVHVRGNYSPIEKDEILKKLRIQLLKINILEIYSRSGTTKGQKRSESEDIIGSIKVELINWKIDLKQIKF